MCSPVHNYVDAEKTCPDLHILIINNRAKATGNKPLVASILATQMYSFDIYE